MVTCSFVYVVGGAEVRDGFCELFPLLDLLSCFSMLEVELELLFGLSLEL